MDGWEDKLAILELVQQWAVWRDAGDWERLRTVWHEDGWTSATWFQGSADRFIELSREGFERGVNVAHFLGGSALDVRGIRAVCQTKMSISQRGILEGVWVDVLCLGRFYDFFEKRDGRWGIVRRQPIYEKDRMDPVTPGTRLELDAAELDRLPGGYRHLAYLQSRQGLTVKTDLPQLKGPEVERLYQQGRAWLDGTPTAFN